MNPTQPRSPFATVSALEVVRKLVSLRRNLLWFFGIWGTGTIIVLLLIPNRFHSTANLLPVESKPIGLSLLGAGTSLSKAAGNILGGKTDEVERFYVILESRTVKERMVEKFNLKEVYDVADSKFPMLDAIKELESRSFFKDQENGNFTITVEAEDPQMAHDMCQYYVEQLNEIYNGVQKQESTQFKNFIENRYNLAIHQLDSVAIAFKDFQKKNRILDVEVQAEQYFSLLSEITSEEIKAKMKYNLLSQTMNESADPVAKAMTEWTVLKKQFQDMISKNDVNNPMLMDFKILPDIGLEYTRLKLELELRQEILKFLTPVVEQARMEEMKNLSVVKIIDFPNVPERKAWPSRSTYLLLSVFASVVLVYLYVTISLIVGKNSAYFASLLNLERE